MSEQPVYITYYQSMSIKVVCIKYFPSFVGTIIKLKGLPSIVYTVVRVTTKIQIYFSVDCTNLCHRRSKPFNIMISIKPGT